MSSDREMRKIVNIADSDVQGVFEGKQVMPTMVEREVDGKMVMVETHDILGATVYFS